VKTRGSHSRDQVSRDARVASRTRRARVLKVSRTSARKSRALERSKTKNRHAFETPAFESGIAAFDALRRARIEAFPGGTAHGDIPDQADGSIGEALAHVDDPAMGRMAR